MAEAPGVNMMGFAAVDGDEVKTSGVNDYHSGNVSGPSVVSTGARGGADSAPDFVFVFSEHSLLGLCLKQVIHI